jgi:hypothetical protein
MLFISFMFIVSSQWDNGRPAGERERDLTPADEQSNHKADDREKKCTLIS